jgi:hypothetical protein
VGGQAGRQALAVDGAGSGSQGRVRAAAPAAAAVKRGPPPSRELALPLLSRMTESKRAQVSGCGCSRPTTVVSFRVWQKLRSARMICGPGGGKERSRGRGTGQGDKDRRLLLLGGPARHQGQPLRNPLQPSSYLLNKAKSAEQCCPSLCCRAGHTGDGAAAPCLVGCVAVQACADLIRKQCPDGAHHHLPCSQAGRQAGGRAHGCCRRAQASGKLGG